MLTQELERNQMLLEWKIGFTNNLLYLKSLLAHLHDIRSAGFSSVWNMNKKDAAAKSARVETVLSLENDMMDNLSLSIKKIKRTQQLISSAIKGITLA